MGKCPRTWLYAIILGLVCSGAVLEVRGMPKVIYLLLILASVFAAMWMLGQAYLRQRDYASWSWMLFLSSLLTILFTTDSLAHATGF